MAAEATVLAELKRKEKKNMAVVERDIRPLLLLLLLRRRLLLLLRRLLLCRRCRPSELPTRCDHI